MIDENKYSCQICGRYIKSKSGIIAHHGYKRPGSGWQTESCMGARHLPYEVSCDLLPPTIEIIKKHIDEVEVKLENFINNPPPTLKVLVNQYPGKKIIVEMPKPESFDPKNPPCCLSSMYCYEGEYSDIERKLQSDIKCSKRDLQYMERRLNNWKFLKN